MLGCWNRAHAGFRAGHLDLRIPQVGFLIDSADRNRYRLISESVDEGAARTHAYKPNQIGDPSLFTAKCSTSFA